MQAYRKVDRVWGPIFTVQTMTQSRTRVTAKSSTEKNDLLLRRLILSDHLFRDGFRLFQWESRRLDATIRALLSLSLARSLALSRLHQGSLGWCKTPLHIGKKRGRGERERERERGAGRKKKTFTFCGFLGASQSPRIPHATHKVSIKAESNTQSESFLPPEKSLSFDSVRLRQP